MLWHIFSIVYNSKEVICSLYTWLTDDAERSGHPNKAAIEENIEKVHHLVLDVRKIKSEWDSWHGKDIRRTRVPFFAWTFGLWKHCLYDIHRLFAKRKNNKCRVLLLLLLFSRSGPNDYYLFTNLKRWLQRNKLHTNEEVNRKRRPILQSLTNRIIPRVSKY